MLLLPTFIRSDRVLHLLILSCIWAIVVSSWDLTMGYAGIFSLGQIAFFAFGAYTSAMLSRPLEAVGGEVIYTWFYIGISPWLGILLGGCVAGLVGIVIALACLRLKGIYIALITIALHEALIPLIQLGSPWGTGGVCSLFNIPGLTIGRFSFNMVNIVPTYYLTLVISFLIYFVIHKIIHSPLGMSFIALRDAEDAATHLGIDDYRLKVVVFVISAFIAGVAGAYYAHLAGLISHHLLALDTFILLITALILGGLGKFPGSILATFFLIFLNDYLRAAELYRGFIFGTVIVLVIIFIPGGLTKPLSDVGHYLYNQLPNQLRHPFSATKNGN